MVGPLRRLVYREDRILTIATFFRALVGSMSVLREVVVIGGVDPSNLVFVFVDYEQTNVSPAEMELGEACKFAN